MIFTIYIKSKQIIDKIKSKAEKEKRSVSYIISEILEKYFAGIK